MTRSIMPYSTACSRLHDVIAIHVVGDAVHGLAGGVRQHVVQDLAHAQDFAGVDVDVGRLPRQALHGRLVDHDARIRQAEALALGAFGQQHRRHGRRLSHADGHDIGTDEGHGVQNREAGRDGTARRIDVNRNILLRILRFEEQQLGDDQIRDLIVNRRAQKDDVLFQQPGVNVVCAFAPRGLFDHHGDKDRFAHHASESIFTAPNR